MSLLSENISHIKEILKKEFSTEATGHDYYHTERVYKLSLKIAETEGGDLEIISYAALLHDISDFKFNGGDIEKGGKIAEEILTQLKVENKIIKQVKFIIDNISYKGQNEKNKINSIEGKVVQDADRLEAIGAIGIARTFAYGGNTGQPIYDPNLKPVNHKDFNSYKNNKSSTINHFYEKLLLLKDKMNTKTGASIALKRHLLMEKFLEDFYNEWNVTF